MYLVVDKKFVCMMFVSLFANYVKLSETGIYRNYRSVAKILIRKQTLQLQPLTTWTQRTTNKTLQALRTFSNQNFATMYVTFCFQHLFQSHSDIPGQNRSEQLCLVLRLLKAKLPLYEVWPLRHAMYLWRTIHSFL